MEGEAKPLPLSPAMSKVIPKDGFDDPWSYAAKFVSPFCFADTETSFPPSPFCLADSTPPTQISYPKQPFCCPDVDFIKRPLIAMDEETTKEAQLLRAELDRVEKDIRDLQSQKTNLLSEIAALEQEHLDALGQVFVTMPAKPHVIAFVGKLERVHLYFKLKEFLKNSDLITYDSDPTDDFIDCLLANQQGMTEFGKLGHVRVRTALTVHIQELKKSQGIPKFREGFKRYKQQFCPGWGDTTHVQEAEQELESMFPTLSLGSEEVVDQYLIVDHFANLLHRMRSENYVMDENPEVELEKIMKCYPLVYQHSELVHDPIRLMTPPPDMGSDIDEVFTKALDKYEELRNAAFMTKKRQRSVSSEGSMSP